MAPMLLTELVATATAVGSTRSRLAKVDAIATLLGRLAPEEIVDATGYLVGDLPQGRIGIGWATIRDLDVTPATEPSITIEDVAHAVDAVRDAHWRGFGTRAARHPRSVVRAGDRAGELTSSAASSSASCARARSPA